jgi:conjugal transfer pilin signal peptidase TrbI
MNLKRILATSFFILSLAMTLAFFKGYGLRYNKSPSLRHTLYLASPLTQIEPNQIVSFIPKNGSVPFAKIIIGMPGDLIEVVDRKLILNGHEIGKILETFAPIKEGVIPDEFYFVAGLHPESYDSRYEEIGLISRTAFRERLWPIF